MTPSLWLDAGAGVTVDGSAHVTGWADQSGGGKDATGAGTWTKVASWSNGKPALLGDGSTTLDGVLSATTAGGACSYLIVGDLPSLASGGSGAAFFTNKTGGLILQLEEIFAAGTHFIETDGISVNVALTTPNVSPFANPLHIEWLLPAAGTAPTHYIAAVSQAIASGTRTNDSGAAGYQIGRSGFNGHIAEIVAVDRALTGAELTSWTSYAKAKYGLSQ